jgi:hypothetical protein
VVFILLAAVLAEAGVGIEPQVFSDGFESGDAGRWSRQVPPAEPVDGTYQFAVYDGLAFASGGNLVVVDGMVEVINGTYFNFEKVDPGGFPQCPLILRWGLGLIPTAVGEFEIGVEFSDFYSDGSQMTWTLTFSVESNIGFSGTLSAVGSGFTGADSGCNGAFPTLVIIGGKHL